MATDLNKLAREMLFTDLEDLTDREKQVLEKFVSHRRISRNVNREFDKESTFGERLADEAIPHAQRRSILHRRCALSQDGSCAR